MEASASGQDVYPHRGVLIRYSAQVITTIIEFVSILLISIVMVIMIKQGCPVPAPPSDGHLVGVNSSLAQLSCR